MTTEGICKKYGVALCYLFGSQQEEGSALLRGHGAPVTDPHADIDFAVLFRTPPKSPLDTYASLSLDLQELVSPFKADLVFLHEVDTLIQLEAIQGTSVFSADDGFREMYEARVLALAADARQVFKRNEKDLFEAIDHGYFEFEYENA